WHVLVSSATGAAVFGPALKDLHAKIAQAATSEGGGAAAAASIRAGYQEFFEINPDEIIPRLRFGSYIGMAEERFGSDAADIIQLILKHGKLQARDICDKLGGDDPLRGKSNLSGNSSNADGRLELLKSAVGCTLNRLCSAPPAPACPAVMSAGVKGGLPTVRGSAVFSLSGEGTLLVIQRRPPRAVGVPPGRRKAAKPCQRGGNEQRCGRGGFVKKETKEEEAEEKSEDLSATITFSNSAKSLAITDPRQYQEFPTLSLHERLLVTGGTDGSFTFHTYPSSKPAWESPTVAFGTGSTEYLRRRTRHQQCLLRLRTAHPPLGPEDRRLPPLACTLLPLRLKSGSCQHPRLRTTRPRPHLGPKHQKLPHLACTLLLLRLKNGSYQHHLHRLG
ncbi:hypothetical protein CF319_g7213, partial [Tilletia indica]